MYFDGPPPQRTTRQKSSPSRNYVPAYRANGTGRDLMSFYPTMQVLPHTAKVYNAIKPVSSKRSSRLPHTTIPRPSGSGRDSFIWQKKGNGPAVTFRPQTTPWGSNSQNPWANDREVTPARLLVKQKRLKYNPQSGRARKMRVRSKFQKEYMKMLSAAGAHRIKKPEKRNNGSANRNQSNRYMNNNKSPRERRLLNASNKNNRSIRRRPGTAPSLAKWR